MSQSASEHAVHFVTPPLRSGRPYENPALPELPNLWSLDHPDTAPIPDEAACRALWTRYAMFSHIERHSECVAGMAEALARRAVETGATRHPELVALSLAAGLLHDMMNGIAFVIQPKNIARMKKDLPILFVSGDCDPVGEQGRGVIRAYKCFLKAGMKDVTMKLYHGGRHEMLNETNRAEVYEDVLSWLNSKTGK